MNTPDELPRDERRQLFLSACTGVLERGLTGALGAQVQRDMHHAVREAAKAAWFDLLAGATINLPQVRGDTATAPPMHGHAFDPDDDADISPPLTDDERAEADRARAYARRVVDALHGGGTP